VVFFLDADDLYRQEHIYRSLVVLTFGAKFGVHRTSALVQVDGDILPEWEHTFRTLMQAQAMNREVLELTDGVALSGGVSRSGVVGAISVDLVFVGRGIAITAVCVHVCVYICTHVCGCVYMGVMSGAYL
jgi:hypothetical protein